MSPDSFGALIAAYGGILVLTVPLPFVASFLLDGVVQVLRGNGLKLFLAAVGMTVVTAFVGYFLWQYGSSNPPMVSSTLASIGTMGKMLLTFSTALALVAFVSRTVKLLWKTR
ncbi:MAG: hypothetical protein H7226_14310 [Salinibacterium sp.]|nr:hypothetical protein [Salinibacterium sp.]